MRTAHPHIGAQALPAYSGARSPKVPARRVSTEAKLSTMSVGLHEPKLSQPAAHTVRRTRLCTTVLCWKYYTTVLYFTMVGSCTNQHPRAQPDPARSMQPPAQAGSPVPGYHLAEEVEAGASAGGRQAGHYLGPVGGVEQNVGGLEVAVDEGFVRQVVHGLPRPWPRPLRCSGAAPSSGGAGRASAGWRGWLASVGPAIVFKHNSSRNST